LLLRASIVRMRQLCREHRGLNRCAQNDMIVPNQPEESSQAASTMAGVFLAIEGPIGVGKTTLARLLQETWQAELVLEHFDENPFLPLFYTDRQRYAWQTQLHFLIDRFDQWTELRSTPPLRVSDYLFDKDRIFAELNLDDVALRRYLKVFHALRSHLRQPTGVIYLHADVEVLLGRITARARPYEQQIEQTYFPPLPGAYERFFAAYDDAPVLALDMTERELLDNADDRRAVLSAVQSAFAARRNHNTIC